MPSVSNAEELQTDSIHKNDAFVLLVTIDKVYHAYDADFLHLANHTNAKKLLRNL